MNIKPLTNLVISLYKNSKSWITWISSKDDDYITDSKSGIIPFTKQELNYVLSDIDNIFLSSLKINLNDAKNILDSGYSPSSKVKKIISNDLLSDIASKFVIKNPNRNHTISKVLDSQNLTISTSFENLLDFTLKNKIYSNEFFTTIFKGSQEIFLAKFAIGKNLNFRFFSTQFFSPLLKNYFVENQDLNNQIFPEQLDNLKQGISPIYQHYEQNLSYNMQSIKSNELKDIFNLNNGTHFYTSHHAIIDFINNNEESILSLLDKNMNYRVLTKDTEEKSNRFKLRVIKQLSCLVSPSSKYETTFLNILDTAIEDGVISSVDLFNQSLLNTNTLPIALTILIKFEQDIIPTLNLGKIGTLIKFLQNSSNFSLDEYDCYYDRERTLPDTSFLVKKLTELQQNLHKQLTDNALSEFKSSHFEKALEEHDFIGIAKLSKFPKEVLNQLTQISDKINILTNSNLDNDSQMFIHNIKNNLTDIVWDFHSIKELNNSVELLEFNESISTIDLNITNLQSQILSEQLTSLKQQQTSLRKKIK